jgi:putative tryptophan/tyrosine transport system substrate-binding protein
MQRRQFIVGLGAAITGSIRTDAQELARLKLVGYLDDGPVEGFVFRQVEFRKGLAAADYFEGADVAIEAHRGRLPYWAGDLVDRGAAVLVASGSAPAILAAKAATTTIPIVFGFGAKRLGLLLDLLPRAARVAVLVDPNDDATAVKSMIADVQAAAVPIGRGIEVFYARDVGGIDAAFAGVVEKRSEVLLVSPSGFFAGRRIEIVALAAQHRVPALYFERAFVEAGGLMSYGPDIAEQYRQLGIYAGRILSGQKPGDLPVRRATKLELVINLKTARTLGLTVPETLLANADGVIQ